MKILLLVLIFGMASCASMKEEIKGYSGNERAKATKLIKGKTAAETKAILGIPAAEGMCTDCRSDGVYHMVYLNKTMPRYSFALTMSNKSTLDCFILYFYYDEASGKHTYTGPGVMEQTGCAQDYGAIKRVREMQQVVTN